MNLLNYQDFEIQKAETWIDNRFPDSNPELFHSRRGWCVFCEKKARPVTQHLKGFGETYLNEVAFVCDSCGWWEHCLHIGGNSGPELVPINKIEIKSAILKRFQIDNEIIPISTLNSYLSKNPEAIFDIHHKKMEELVSAVFNEHYRCEVHIVGKSHDGGQDLVLIEGDTTSIVQVKRRKNRASTEPVSSIRDLIGATLLASSKKSIFVTTADHFSKEAKKSAKMAIEKGIVESFELYDFHEFFNIMKLYKDKLSPEPWASHIQLKS